jgi:hypothetical protein
MAESTGPMLAVTGISFANQWLGNGDFNISILVAGGIATAMLAGLEKVPGAQPIAVGIAWIAFLTLMFTRLNGQPSPVDNLKKLTGL